MGINITHLALNLLKGDYLKTHLFNAESRLYEVEDFHKIYCTYTVNMFFANLRLTSSLFFFFFFFCSLPLCLLRQAVGALETGLGDGVYPHSRQVRGGGH